MNEREMVRFAALLEAQQAERDFVEAYADLRASGFKAGSPEDYRVWSMSEYADSAKRATPRRPPTPGPTVGYIRMADGVKGARTPRSGSIVRGRQLRRRSK